MNQIKSLTYLVNDVDTLDSLEDQLKVSLELLENEVPKEEGVIVQPVKVKRKVKVSNIKNKISKAKRIKSNLTGRAGVKAEQMKLSSNLTLPNLIKEPVNPILEEVAPADNAMYDIPMQETNNPNYSDETVKKENCVVEEETEEDVLEESDDEIPITGYFEAHGPVKKRRTMLFSDDEKKLIKGNEMLTDESMNLAMSLIHEQFSHIGGLTDSSIRKCQQFDIVPSENGYIQILHAGSMQWICVANMTSGKSSNQVHYVFNSLFSRKIQQDVIHQIAAYSFCPENELIIHVMPVQQQKNGVDCGLFSIAFATSLAFREDPSNSTYDSAALRPHLIKCLTSGRISPFPKIEGKRVVRCKPSTHTVEIFCSCRTPWTAQRNSSYDMAQCCMCSEWYHKRCEKNTTGCFL